MTSAKKRKKKLEKINIYNSNIFRRLGQGYFPSRGFHAINSTDREKLKLFKVEFQYKHLQAFFALNLTKAEDGRGIQSTLEFKHFERLIFHRIDKSNY